MGTQRSFVGERLRNSYWFTPSLMLLGTVVLATATIAIDDNADLEQVGWLRPLVFSGTVDGAREVLAVIAASMIGVAGVVFSITLVSLQLASSQFGPRMLANFMRDRGNQITLGTFVSAFLYSLIVLRTIRSDDKASVPHLSVTVALGLGIAGLSVLIYYIHHISTTIQAPTLIQSITKDFLAAIDTLFPHVEDVDDARELADGDLPDDDADGRSVTSGTSGNIQVVDLEELVELAREHDLMVRLEKRPGRFVVHATPVAHVWPGGRVDDELADRIAGTITTGSRRTVTHDIEFPIRQLVEIGVRSLGPGMNDPFTASNCVDQISVGLCTLASRPFPSPRIGDVDRKLRVVVGDPVTFERLVGGGFDQIRQAAKFHAQVYLHLLDALTRIAGCVEDPARLPPLLEQGRLVLEATKRELPEEADQKVVRARYDALRVSAGSG